MRVSASEARALVALKIADYVVPTEPAATYETRDLVARGPNRYETK